MTNDVASDDDNKVTAIGFLVKVWDERLFVGIVTAIFLIAVEAYIIYTPTRYTATLLVGHVTSVDSTPGASSSGGLSGTIALIGLGTGFSNDTKFNLFLTLVKTENFARRLDAKYHYVGRKHGETTIPSLAALTGTLGGLIILNASDTTTVSMQSPDRAFAKEFLLDVYHEGNMAVRSIDVERARKFTDFIENRFRSESSRPMLDAMGSLLVNQERFLMVTSVDLPYAVQLLDGPTASATPTSPRKRLLQMIGLTVGVAFSIFLILVWEAVTSERRGRGLSTRGPTQWLRSLGKRLTGGSRRKMA